MSMLLSALLYVDFYHLRLVWGVAGAPPWTLAAPDLAVDTWAWVQTGVNRRSMFRQRDHGNDCPSPPSKSEK